MVLQIGTQDGFEREYVEKFHAIAAKYCELVSYKYDRAALDVGMHLLQEPRGNLLRVRVWAQLKGIRESSLSKEEYERSSLDIRWFLAFVNADAFDDAATGAYRAVIQGGLQCAPQLRGDLAFNLLTSTSVYLEFRDRISWASVDYLR